METVEWKKLGDVCKIKRGKRVTKNDLIPNGKYPVISGGQEPMGYINECNRAPNTITVAQYGAAGYVDWQTDAFWANDVCYSLYPNDELNNRFLYYCLKLSQEYIYSIRNVEAVPFSLPVDRLNSIIVPVPPLSVQRSIVEKLDACTGLVGEIGKELELRRKQYEHCREKLLQIEGGEWKKLGEVGIFTRGNGLQKSDFTEEGFPCIHYGQIHTVYGAETKKTVSFCSDETAKKLRKAKTGDLLIATTSEDVEACCKALVWFGDGEVAYSTDSFCFSHNQNPKYMAYVFQTEAFARWKRKYAVGAKVVRVSGEAMAKFKFKFPPLSVQRSIVEKLDAFEGLIGELERELALREQQYEHLREKLLAFA